MLTMQPRSNSDRRRRRGEVPRALDFGLDSYPAGASRSTWRYGTSLEQGLRLARKRPKHTSKRRILETAVPTCPNGDHPNRKQIKLAQNLQQVNGCLRVNPGDERTAYKIPQRTLPGKHPRLRNSRSPGMTARKKPWMNQHGGLWVKGVAPNVNPSSSTRGSVNFA